MSKYFYLILVLKLFLFANCFADNDFANKTASKYIKLSPQTQVLKTSLEPKRTLSQYKNFFEFPLELSLEEYNKLPQILGAQTDLDSEMFSFGQMVYIYSDMYLENTNVELYSVDKPIENPQTHEILGVKYRLDGKAVVIHNGAISDLLITKAYNPITKQDRVAWVVPENFAENIVPANKSLNGQVIGVYDNSSLASLYSTLIIDLGARDGIQAGNMLSLISQSALNIKDAANKSNKMVLATDEIGDAVVYSVSEKYCLALVLNAIRPIALLTKAQSRIE